jgi:BirA family biotin operon repressor/biotin-[acetyl-CoA-carboxylase] ligase
MIVPNTKQYLVRHLADGCFRSGQELAERLGISRAAVWKQLRTFPDALGIEIDAVRGRGYRLRQPIELLDVPRIRKAIAPAARPWEIIIHDSVDSTNSWLLSQARAGMQSATVCLAERQMAGRGRHGRRWVSPYGANIYLSMLWRYAMAPVELGGLSLACGVAVAKALVRIGVARPGLKWPNDVLWQGRKLAGLLLEVGGEATGPSYVVVGVGINTRLTPADGERIDQPWIDLASMPGVSDVSRNRLAAFLISELTAALKLYGKQGLGPFVSEWSSYDCFQGELVTLNTGTVQISGDYRGITSQGAIRLQVDGQVHSFTMGEVSLCRPRG